MSNNPVSLVIARRFIFSAKRFKVINAITGVSMLGLVVGVATLCIVLSVLNGFRSLVGDLFRSIDNDVQLVAASGKWVSVSDSLLDDLRRQTGVGSASRFVQGKVVMATNRSGAVVILKGMEATAYNALGERFEIKRRPLEGSGITTGYALASRLGIGVETPVRLLSPETIDEGLTALQSPLGGLLGDAPATPVEYRIQNLFTLQRSFDENYVLTSLRNAQAVFRLSSNGLQDDSTRCTGIDVRAAAGLSDEDLKARLEVWLAARNLGGTYQLVTLSDKNAELFRVMKLEKWGSFAVLMLIVVVASLSLVGSLTMTAIEKKRELYFLHCIGLGTAALQRIFLFEGLLIASIGIALGLTLGAGICWAQQTFGLVKLYGSEAFIISAYPVTMNAADFLYVALATAIVSFIASLYPARKAAVISERLNAVAV